MSLVGYETGQIIWVESPRVAQVVIANLEGASTNPKHKANDITCSLAEKVLNKIGKKLNCRGADTIYSSWWAGDGFDNGWVSFYKFGSELIPPEKRIEQEKLALLETLSATASWIFSFEGCSIMTERPITSWTSNLISESPVLHSATGPSVKYPDWEQFHYRGTQIPRDFIMNRDKYTAQQALQWSNLEQRTALCELMGWEKIIQSLGKTVKVVDEDPDPKFGTLLQVDLPDAPRQQFLRAKCGTGRWITIQVDENAKTAVEAGASSYGISPEMYRKLNIRT
jgi:hypothetical protein